MCFVLWLFGIGRNKIGNKVTIGAGAIVVKDVPDNVILAGFLLNTGYNEGRTALQSLEFTPADFKPVQ